MAYRNNRHSDIYTDTNSKHISTESGSKGKLEPSSDRNEKTEMEWRMWDRM